MRYLLWFQTLIHILPFTQILTYIDIHRPWRYKRTHAHYCDVTWTSWRLISPARTFSRYYQRGHRRCILLSLCKGNLSVTGGSPSQWVIDGESISTPWCDHFSWIHWCNWVLRWPWTWDMDQRPINLCWSRWICVGSGVAGRAWCHIRCVLNLPFDWFGVNPINFEAIVRNTDNNCTQITMSCWIVEFKLISRLPHMFFEQGMHRGLINGYDSVNEASMILPRYKFAWRWCKFMRNPTGVNHHLFDKNSSVSMITPQEWKMVVVVRARLTFYLLTFRNKTISILMHILRS